MGNKRKPLKVKYRDMTPEQKKEYHKAYYEANKEKYKRMSNDNYHANRDENIRKRKEHYWKHHEERKEYSKKYYHEHIEENRKRGREYNKTHKRENKNRALIRYHGLTLIEYENMVQNQKGRCAICGEVPSKRLVVDHDHRTGKIRKLLCDYCNIGLGHVKDNIEILENMIEYLKQYDVKKDNQPVIKWKD